MTMVMIPIEAVSADIRLVVARPAADPIRMVVKQKEGDAMAAVETLVSTIRIVVAIIAEETVRVGATTPGGIVTLPMDAKGSSAQREPMPEKNSSQSVHQLHP